MITSFWKEKETGGFWLILYRKIEYWIVSCLKMWQFFVYSWKNKYNESLSLIANKLRFFSNISPFPTSPWICFCSFILSLSSLERVGVWMLLFVERQCPLANAWNSHLGIRHLVAALYFPSRKSSIARFIKFGWSRNDISNGKITLTRIIDTDCWLIFILWLN